MNNIRITMIQTHLHWHDAEANRAHFSQQIQAIEQDTDVIILPEMFTTGFTMDARNQAENEPGESLQWMQRQAKQYQSAITGSVIIRDQDNFYNRLYWVEPDGRYLSYDKKHLFTFANEDQHFTAGSERLIVNYKKWRICPLVCYDLRFPVWSRNDVDYDVLIYIANWPAPRQNAWQSLLRARAIENMSYVAGVNRVGSDGNDHDYNGGSAIYDPLGQQLSTPENTGAFTETITLSQNDLKQQRQRFGFLKDRDNFILT